MSENLVVIGKIAVGIFFFVLCLLIAAVFSGELAAAIKYKNRSPYKKDSWWMIVLGFWFFLILLFTMLSIGSIPASLVWAKIGEVGLVVGSAIASICASIINVLVCYIVGNVVADPIFPEAAD